MQFGPRPLTGVFGVVASRIETGTDQAGVRIGAHQCP
jgi:hypothetical protein